MPVVEQQPEPGRSSHGSPSELLSWLFFLIGLFKDPHFSLLLPPAARSKIDSLLQVKEPISPPLSLDAQSEWGGAKMFFLPVYHVCLRLLVGEGKKGPHSRVCCIIMSSQVGTAGRCQLHYTRQHPKLWKYNFKAKKAWWQTIKSFDTPDRTVWVHWHFSAIVNIFVVAWL